MRQYLAPLVTTLSSFLLLLHLHATYVITHKSEYVHSFNALYSSPAQEVSMTTLILFKRTFQPHQTIQQIVGDGNVNGYNHIANRYWWWREASSYLMPMLHISSANWFSVLACQSSDCAAAVDSPDNLYRSTSAVILPPT